MGRQSVRTIIAALALGALVPVAAAQGAAAPVATAQVAQPSERSPPRRGAVLRVQVDNDVFGDQDQGYSSGVLLDWVSERRDAFDAVRGTRSFYLGQFLYTPKDGRTADPIPDDRPYVAALLAGFGAANHDDDGLVRNDLQIGFVGPSVRGEASQRAVHRVTGDIRFRGWANQLKDEPVLEYIHQRHRRLARSDSVELLGSAAGRLGNLLTSADAGLELRFGSNLPRGFGGTQLRPVAPPSLLAIGPTGSGVLAAGFLVGGVRFVARDLTLDGSTFRASPSVERRPVVGEVGYGFALALGDWQLVFGRFHRSREFATQRERPIYGSVTIGLRLR